MLTITCNGCCLYEMNIYFILSFWKDTNLNITSENEYIYVNGFFLFDFWEKETIFARASFELSMEEPKILMGPDWTAGRRSRHCL